jgi:hypothetical protein
MINAKVLLLVLCGIGIGVGGYFLIRKSNNQLKQEILGQVPAEEWPRWMVILNQMTRQELLDTAQVMRYRENTPKSVIDQLDPAFKARVIAIGQKYNIFT